MRHAVLLPLTLFFAITATLFGCNNSPHSQQTESLTCLLKWRHQAQFAGVYIADKKGFFKSEHLNVRLVPRQADCLNRQMVQKLLDSEASFAILSGDYLLTACSQGAPIVAIAVIFQRNPYTYAVLKGSQIKRPNDLIGKTIMLPIDAEIQHLALLKKLKLNPNDIKLHPYDRDADFLSKGIIDAQMVYRTGSGLRLEARGLELDFIWAEDYGIRLYADTIVTTRKIIQQRPDLVERFLRAVLKGWRYAIENPEEAVSQTLTYDPDMAEAFQTRILSRRPSSDLSPTSPVVKVLFQTFRSTWKAWASRKNRPLTTGLIT